MKSARRALAAVAIAALAVSALVGCIGAGPVTTKTNAILDELRNLPGVVDANTRADERSAQSQPHSMIELKLDPAATVAHVETIVTTFAHANVTTGLDVLSSELHLVVDGGPDKLELLYPDISDTQATTLAQGWLDLRARYASTDLAMVSGTGTGYVVNLSVGLGQSSFVGDVTALHDAQGDFAKLGDVGRYEQVDGRFAASGGLPADDDLRLLAVIDTVLAADGQEPDLRGEYDGMGTSFTLVATVADSTDGATGLNAAAVRALDAIPASSPLGLRLQFVSAADRHVIGTFDNRSCDAYSGAPADDPGRLLLAYWARDGRTLLDGSVAESC
jgi:hypothetical protein